MFERLFKKEEPKVDVKVEKFSHERLVGWYQPVVARILQEDFNISRNLANHISNGLVDDAITNFETNDIINYMDWFVDKELGLFKAGLEKRETNKEEFIMKSLHNTDVNGARKNVSDIQVFGDGDMFQLLCKASSEKEGWMKSTKAMEILGIGCVVQVTTQQRNPDGSYSIAEAVTFVPGVHIVDDVSVSGRRLARF